MFTAIFSVFLVEERKRPFFLYTIREDLDTAERNGDAGCAETAKFRVHNDIPYDNIKQLAITRMDKNLLATRTIFASGFTRL